MSDERRKWIAKNYAQMLNTEMAQILGCSPSNVSKYLAMMNLTRSAEDIATLKARAQARWRQRCIENGSHIKRAKKLRRRYLSEKLNLLSGQPQATKMRVNILTRQQTREQYNLNRKLNIR